MENMPKLHEGNCSRQEGPAQCLLPIQSPSSKLNRATKTGNVEKLCGARVTSPICRMESDFLKYQPQALPAEKRESDCTVLIEDDQPKNPITPPSDVNCHRLSERGGFGNPSWAEVLLQLLSSITRSDADCR